VKVLAGTGTEVGKPRVFGMLASILMDLDRVDEAHGAVVSALEISARKGNRFWEADLRRLNGEIHLTRGDVRGAEREFEEALALARDQRAASLELRVVLSLARASDRLGRRYDPRDFLESACSRFEEGVDCAELRQARAFIAA
jgi:tetratricopeptide (TPR) repeat protein